MRLYHGSDSIVEHPGRDTASDKVHNRYEYLLERESCEEEEELT